MFNKLSKKVQNSIFIIGFSTVVLSTIHLNSLTTVKHSECILENMKEELINITVGSLI